MSEKIAAEILSRYRPIDYRTVTPFGGGENIDPPFTERERTVWRGAFEYQDKRLDPGHAEVVTYFGLRLAELFELSRVDTEVVVLACIFHDTGYALMENVNERFRRAVADQQSRGIVSDRDHPELWQIRVEHQEQSCDLARRFLEGYPRLQEVIEIIGDHDTRDRPPSFLAELMRDADHLWRVHLGHLKAYPPESTITRDALKDRLLRSCRFHTEVARQIAEIEVENSIGAM